MNATRAGKKQPLHVAIASLLRRDINAIAGPYLPSVSQLTKTYRVSRKTLLGAVQLLRMQGVLEFRQGQRIGIAGRVPEPRSPRVRPCEELYRRLVHDIEEGVLESGNKLPKRSYYAVSRRISTHTVDRAYKQLCLDRKVHREGRSFVVGPPRELSGDLRVHRSSTIGVLFAPSTNWEAACTNRRNGPFYQTFAELALRHEVHLRTVAVESATDGQAGLTNEVALSILTQNPSYLGTLIVGDSATIDGHADVVCRLVAHGQPVVWFDRNGEGPGPRELPQGLFRFYYSPTRVASTAIEFLSSLGHRCAYYPFIQKHPWERERLDALTKAGALHRPSLRVCGRLAFTNDDWTHEIGAELRELLCRIERSKSPIIERLLAMFADGVFRPSPAPSRQAATIDGFVAWSRSYNSQLQPGPPPPEANVMWDLIRMYEGLSDPDVTAMIMPNDSQADRFMASLRYLGVRIPGELSIISFDNRNRYLYHPLTTVDYGFDGLAYKAFHLMLGDVKISGILNREVAANPRVVDRGSAGPAERVLLRRMNSLA